MIGYNQASTLKGNAMFNYKLLGLVSLSFLLGACSPSSNDTQSQPEVIAADVEPVVIAEPAPIAPTITLEQKDAIVKYFMNNDEPAVKDATWKDKGSEVLYLGVLNDKGNRDGYADYACQILIDDFDMAGRGIQVHIMDIVKIANDGKWVQLGKSICK